MKSFKKFIGILLVIGMLLSVVIIPAAAESKRLNYLLLGDSIAQGFGVDNPDEASYGKIVADTNGYNYKNDAVVARNSDQMLYYIRNDAVIRKDIREADIISLSIGSNDYLANDMVAFLVVGALLGINNRTLDRIADGYYDNLCNMIDEMRALNPNAVILLQNDYVAWTGFAGRAFSAGASRVNSTVNKYLKNHPNNGVYLCDIAPAITGHKDRLADDCVHPNAKGNVEIAKIVLKQLKDLGLGTKTEPVINVAGKNYNFFVKTFGTVLGPVITVIVKVLTGNAQNI